MEKAFFKRISSVIFSSDKTELDICQQIYYKCLLASRKQEFYTKFEVADTFDGCVLDYLAPTCCNNS